METKSTDYVYDNVIQIEDADASRKFIAKVFAWMFVALGISAAFAFLFAANPQLSSLLRDSETRQNTIFGTVAMFLPLVFVFVSSAVFSRGSYFALALVFIGFSAAMGISLSNIFYFYPITTISGVFITTSVVFGAMAIGGYITHQDLTKFGGIMIMLLIGIVVASVLNLLIFRSSGMDLIISYIGVAVFTGLTAYDVQKLKRIGASGEVDGATKSKVALMGALTLYLDFVNLFLMLLRIFGGNRR
ncbi:Bax inhibitor-1/YccA family protein [Mucilaginibacter achroorhodeus]|uniref:Bax inhibitor-1/YccA family protein n=1 Tax=Mucilaginibacter achroorhodeus TaxID=2599294 RepID=A0A563TX22_9SPHI|nr:MULTISPECIES: Bax inhibitor-1/YccA family protein [Mucilaginibacter]QXV65781.1 Bax inhibitor-1/YccA family protein [Mucilaginibacter sp. 21P]TWR23917.1 Bax inhibitor-1/YccA family protein [Mucilaginibacter achroorhodeus]